MKIEELQTYIHSAQVSAGWWNNLETGETLTGRYPINVRVNIAEKLCLIHSEISEAMEGARKGLMDDKLPNRSMLKVELADAVIRCFDLAGGSGLDLMGALVDKMEYNSKRDDHKIENRKLPWGKKF